jgi:hypothetical protein
MRGRRFCGGDGAFGFEPDVRRLLLWTCLASAVSCRCEEAYAGSRRKRGVWRGGSISADSNRVIRRDPRLEGRVVALASAGVTISICS